MKNGKGAKFGKTIVFVGLCTILVSLGIGTASAENMIVDTVADFNYINNNGDWHPNNWGGKYGPIYNITLGGCCTQSRDINIYHGCSGAALRLDYNVTEGFAGWYTKFQWSPTEYDKDLSDYEEFHFWVRGDPVNGCTSTFKVEFKDGDTIGEYIVEGVNTSWQEIIINLSYDVSPQPDWQKMDEFTIIFEDWRVTERKGTLYVDDIQFIDTDKHYKTDKEFLDFVAEKAFMYFWETAQTVENTNPTSYGLIPDTTGNVGYATYDRKSSIAGNGFGLTALCIGAEMGRINKSEAEERVYKALLSHRNIQLKQSQNSSLWGKYCFFYHFLDINPDNGRENNGQRDANTEVSSIDTALFIAGVITAGEYFGYNESIKNLAEEIYSAVQWNKFFNTSLNQFYMGWKPEYGSNYTISASDGGYFTYNISTGWNGTWDTYTDEALLICLLAAGAPNESYRVPINNSFYSFNKRSWENCNYVTYPYPNGTRIISSWSGSLFNYFFAHCWWDFRNKEDLKNVNWWNNSVNAALANKYYCNHELKNKFQTYNDANCWGVTACSGNCNYLEKTAKPCWCCNASCPISGHPTDEGTLAPYGAISCMPFFSYNKSENPSFQSLKHYVEKSDQKLWNQYGPVDSFNLGNNSSCEDDWYAPGYLAIGVGPMLIGIHNYHAMNDPNISSTYDWFMNNTHITMVDDATLNKKCGGWNK
uniref:Glycoamylase-like domain-containing protein n=1 Tax=Candidatus Methanophaga sp. ANME-1 ERB7 TaxID=2759913 RepID=A0A7G9Z7K5_9EURY|nr:hypothetical protein BCGBNPPC_00023 [Methanosarcinales archaeon ANME-1 ERB7]